MLLNLTYTPLSRWPSDQWKVARQRWGKVRDYPLPIVDLKATIHQEALLARKTVRRVVDMAPDAVLCQGKQPLNLALIALLQREGIPVYYINYRRYNLKRRIGYLLVKTSEYRFCGFQEYPLWPWPSQTRPPHTKKPRPAIPDGKHSIM